MPAYAAGAAELTNEPCKRNAEAQSESIIRGDVTIQITGAGSWEPQDGSGGIFYNFTAQ